MIILETINSQIITGNTNNSGIYLIINLQNNNKSIVNFVP